MGSGCGLVEAEEGIRLDRELDRVEQASRWEVSGLAMCGDLGET